MKNEIRTINKAKRAEMSKSDVIEKSRECAKEFLISDFYKNADVIMLYIPLGNETDTTEIIKKAHDDNKRCVFPVTDEKSGIITPYYAERDTDFKKGAFAVMEPCKKEVADINDIDVIIVPGVAFCKNGGRIGFGKGCYDRFLESTRAIKIGYCYNFQLCDEIAGDAHDVNMDYLITESGMIACE